MQRGYKRSLSCGRKSRLTLCSWFWFICLGNQVVAALHSSFIYIVSFSSARIRFSKWCAVPPYPFHLWPTIVRSRSGFMEYRIEASAALSAPANRGNRSHVQLSSLSGLDVSPVCITQVPATYWLHVYCVCACIYTIMYCDLCMHISIEPYITLHIYFCMLHIIYKYILIIYNYI